MKILVTGGAGFIASHVVDRFIAEGHRVVVVDNLSHGKRANVNPKASFHKLDIADRPAMADRFRTIRPQRVVNLAAQAGVRYSIENPHAY
ncbi:MAG TPA: NAD-dependent epimerase/dehydratase family protein, partial [bacterium]|nr:NAD-dependent epimerase/dehydratase family protein [bacterium]